MIPYFIYNILISGYIIFPVIPLKFINFSWTIPEAIGNHLLKEVNAWARFPGEGYMENLNLPFYEWIPRWYHFYSKKNIHGSVDLILIYTLLLQLLPLFVLFPTLGVRIYSSNKLYLFLFLPLIFSWFFNSPDPRFGYSFLVTFPFFSLSLEFSAVLKFLYYNTKLKNINNILLTLILLVIFFIIKENISFNFLYKFSFKEYPYANGSYKYLNSGIKVFKPNDYKCWKINDLCSSYIDPKLAKKKGLFDMDIFFIERTHESFFFESQFIVITK